MSPNKRNLMVGIVVLAGIGILAWMILKFANRAATFFLTKGTHVTVIAERADGVSEGSAVYFRGVNVGRVLAVVLAPDQRVHIGAIIDPDKQVPKDVEGIIRTGNLLSASASIFLEPLPQAVAPTRMIREGDVIEATVPTGNALLPREFNETLREFQERKMLQHMDETVVTIRQQAVKAGQLMDSIRDVTGDPAVQGDLRRAITNFRTATEQADRIAANLEKFSGDLDGLSKQASDTMTEIHGAVGDARKQIGVTGEQLEVTTRNVNGRIDQVGKLLEQFQAIAGKVQRGEGTAGKLVTDARLYESMADTAAQLRLMVADLRRLVQQWEQEGLSFKLGK